MGTRGECGLTDTLGIKMRGVDSDAVRAGWLVLVLVTGVM